MTEPQKSTDDTQDVAPLKGAADPTTTGHEQYAGGRVDDGFPGEDGEDPPVITQQHSPNRVQQPEVEEFGARAVESGDPDEDRPNGDPAVVGHPVGGGERSPEAPAVEDDQADGEQAGAPYSGPDRG